jgi:hypothetical protein
MDGEGGLPFPNIGNNTMQRSETKAFTRDIAHDTKIPNFKFWLNILRGYSTSFGEVIKGKILKFGTGNSRSIGKEEVPLFATVRSRGRFTYSGVESSFFLFFFFIKCKKCIDQK